MRASANSKVVFFLLRGADRRRGPVGGEAAEAARGAAAAGHAPRRGPRARHLRIEVGVGGCGGLVGGGARLPMQRRGTSLQAAEVDVLVLGLVGEADFVVDLLERPGVGGRQCPPGRAH